MHMVSSRQFVALLILVTLILPMTASEIGPKSDRGGYDAAGEWQPRNSLEIHDEWWMDWSRDANQDRIDDRLAWLLTQPIEVNSEWWKRAEPGHARIFIDYDHHPSTADVEALEELLSLIHI